MKDLFLYLFVFLFSSVQLEGQVPYGGKPYPYTEKKISRERIIMPRFDYNWVLSEIQTNESREGRKTLPVAWNYEVNLSPSNSGEWQVMSDGVKVWRLETASAGAFALSVFFEEFALLPGARIFLYDPSQEQILGGFDHRSNKPSGTFPVSYINGEQIVIELQVDENILDYGTLRIGSVSHGFADVFGGTGKKDGFFGESGECNVDINCPSGDAWQEVKRAVCRIIFKRSSGSVSELCTGTLINNTSRDQTTFLLTANHCIDRAYAAQTSVFYFEYESPECDGPDGMVNKTLSGSALLSTSDSLDFSLLLLSEEIPETYNPYFAGWSISNSPSQSSVTIHHPQGDVKKISTDNDPVTSQYQPVGAPSWLNVSVANGFWRVIRWDEGTTEGGSSGSPLFNPARQIVGNLTGGDATCANPANDYFSKFHLNWNYYADTTKQLKYWLDKINTGLTSISGLDPYFITDSSLTIMEVIGQFPELSTFVSFLNNTGFDDELSGEGLFTVFAPVDDAFSTLPPSILNSLLSDPTGDLAGTIGYHIVNESLPSTSLQNGQGLNTLSNRLLRIERLDNEIYVDYAIITVADIIAKNGRIHFIDAVLFPVNPTIDPFSVFPSPADGEFWITIHEGSMKGATLNLYSIKGELVADYMINDDKLSRFNITGFPPGFYVVKILHNDLLYTKKLLISNTIQP